MKRAISFFIVTLALCGSVSSKQFVDQISTAEFEAAGLDKLSSEELARLESLIADFKGNKRNKKTKSEKKPAAVVAPTAEEQEDLMGREQVAAAVPKNAPKKIESRLVGTFEGWYGETKFELENGQIWQQRIEERQKYTSRENPKVTIYRSIGGYRMRFEGYNQSCPVKRIK